MRAEAQAGLGLAVALAALLPPVADLMQARLPVHVLIWIPAVAGGGALAGAAAARGRPAGWTAAPALLGGAVALCFWIIPRWIDAALADPATALARAATLVVAAGLPLGWGWAQAGPVLRLFALANAASMLAVMGWILLVAPARLCNSYLLGDQRDLGLGLIVVALALVATGVLRAMAGGAAPPAGAPRAGADGMAPLSPPPPT